MDIESLNKFYSDYELLKQFVIQRANIKVIKKYDLKYLPIFKKISLRQDGNWVVGYYIMNSINEETYFVDIEIYELTCTDEYWENKYK